jgi:hypothetical protein
MKRLKMTAQVPDDFRKLQMMLFLDKFRAELDDYEIVEVKQKDGSWKRTEGTTPLVRLGNASVDIFEGGMKLGRGLLFLIVAVVMVAYEGVRWIWKKPGGTIFDNVKDKKVK